mmetsp:Transcript_68066/g.107985  ORF Transcript_68066/g.107985 Transcript_68066/m.107985 type:complete len:82 (-) Transcript_68066:199-444(-)|eukprot:CAMPEP_0169137288 /NCGR_PEP_ID=MMETSP1015-20121227/41446_1 /TAXON_ID=342587 /ORGANISM="Karlodinium micrum, Strain CCMP2283" /LENGTH=81 /DNA_ID=CAMNT_0009202097 /DNA_START=76 /DNA_END=321 /DNA_ORIENTATION=+
MTSAEIASSLAPSDSESSSLGPTTQAGNGQESSKPHGVKCVSDMDDFEKMPDESMQEIWKMFNIGDPRKLQPSTISRPSLK